MPAFRLEALAYPGVVSLVSFLALTSQWLFYNIQPGPLRKGEAYIFNALVLALLVCYTRTCYTDPGRIPSDWHRNIQTKDECARVAAEASSRQRYCRKCDMPKPPRAHHCKICKRYVVLVHVGVQCRSGTDQLFSRCIMKMDHHCVWTGRLLFLFSLVDIVVIASMVGNDFQPTASPTSRSHISCASFPTLWPPCSISNTSSSCAAPCSGRTAIFPA